MEYTEDEAIKNMKKLIKDVTLSRTDAMDRCINLGKKFIEHFDKLFKEPNSNAKNHWISEMKNWYKSVKEIKLKQTNKPILDGELRDWFFTAGANPQDFMQSPTTEELSVYDAFTSKVISGNNIESALRSLKMVDKKVKDVYVKGPRGEFKLSEKTRSELEKEGYGFHHSFETDGGRYSVMVKNNTAVACRDSKVKDKNVKEYLKENRKEKDQKMKDSKKSFTVKYKDRKFKVKAKDHQDAARKVIDKVKDEKELELEDDRLSPMTYKKLREMGYDSEKWKNLTQEQANKIVANARGSEKSNSTKGETKKQESNKSAKTSGASSEYEAAKAEYERAYAKMKEAEKKMEAEKREKASSGKRLGNTSKFNTESIKSEAGKEIANSWNERLDWLDEQEGLSIDDIDDFIAEDISLLTRTLTRDYDMEEDDALDYSARAMRPFSVVDEMEDLFGNDEKENLKILKNMYKENFGKAAEIISEIE